MSIAKSYRVVFAVLALFFVAVSPARAEWRKAQSPHFIVYGDIGEGDLRTYVQKVERFDALLRLWFPVQSDIDVPPLTIYLAEGRADMLKVWPDMPEGIGGFYARSDERIFAVTGGRGRENDHTLFHEYGHHYMNQYMTGAYPGWFIEGFAEFFATADLTAGRMRVGLHSEGRMNSLTQGANTWMPMETVLRSRSSEVMRDGPAYYAQSWALTHYFLSVPERRAKLALYLRAIMDGSDPVAALEHSVGRTPDQLQNDVRRYISGPINFLSQAQEFPPVDITVTRLSPAEADLIWMDLRLVRFVPEERRAGNLAETRRLAQRYPGDPFATRVLAQALLDMQQDDEAVAVMAPVVEAGPDDAATQRFYAVTLMDAGDKASEAGDDTRQRELYSRARQALAAAYRNDANDYRIYIGLNRNRAGAPNYPSDNDLEILRTGVALAPQLPTLRVNAARAVMARGFYAEAVGYLTPVANDPHGGEGLDEVRRLLNEALEKAGHPEAVQVPDAASPTMATPAETPPAG